VTPGALIREARQRAGLTQVQLARLARTSQPTISAYESGAKEPGADALVRLLAAAGFTVELKDSPASMSDYLAAQDKATPAETLAAAVQRGAEDGDVWLALREFLDTFRLVANTQRREDVEKLFSPEPPTGGAQWDAFVGALAEHLLQGLPAAPPRWSVSADRFLDRWWFPHSRRAFDALAVRDSPAAFRRRGIFICPSMLERC
jgi:transcriptional regulator with XRE-family HTH domain